MYLVVWKLRVLSNYIYRFSAEHGISLMTFDNEMELHKIKKLYPTARWIKLSVSLKTKYTYSWFIFTRHSYYNQSTFIPPKIKKTYLKFYLQIGSLNISVFTNYMQVQFKFWEITIRNESFFFSQVASANSYWWFQVTMPTGNKIWGSLEAMSSSS